MQLSLLAFSGTALTQVLLSSISFTNDVFYGFVPYQDEFLAFGPQHLYRINVTSFTMTQNNSFIPNIINNIGVYQNSLFVLAQQANTNFFFKVPINDFSAAYQTKSESAIVNYVAFDEVNGFMLVGAYGYLQKWNLKTMTLLESVTGLTVKTLLVQNQAVYIGGTFPIGSNFMFQERNTTKFQTATNYVNGRVTDQVNQFIINGDFIFAGLEGYNIQQWNLTSKSLYKTFSGHTSYVFTVAIYDQFLFSGSNDNYWSQWHLETGQIIRKVNTNKPVAKILVQYPYLYAVVFSGILKYQIIDFVQTQTAQTTATQIKTTLKIVVSATIIEQAVSSVATSQFESISSTPDLLFFSTKAAVHQVVPTKQVLSSFTNQLEQNLSIYVVIGVLVAFLLLIVTVVTIAYRCNLKKREKSGPIRNTTTQISTTTTTTTSSNFGNSSSFEQSSSNSGFVSSTYTDSISTTTLFKNDTTTISTQQIYSIPGYLQMKPEFIRLLRQLTKGGQGFIYIAEMLQSDLIQKYQTKQVIVKSIGKNFDQLSEREMKSFNQELAIISFFIGKKGFVALYGYLLEPAALVLKFYPLGNMENLINRKAHFQQLVTSKSFILSFLREFAKAVSLLHDAGFVHCDIKPQNILLEADKQGNLHPILTDFGIAQVVSDKVLKVKAMTVENLRGFSLYYGAPEQILQLKNLLNAQMMPEMVKRRDIFAMAGLIYCLLMNKEPWHT